MAASTPAAARVLDVGGRADASRGEHAESRGGRFGGEAHIRPPERAVAVDRGHEHARTLRTLDRLGERDAGARGPARRPQLAVSYVEGEHQGVAKDEPR